jgi:hypothetical protein
MPKDAATPLQLDARHWRQRAENARAMAETFADPGAKRLMRGIADSYDLLAERAERRRDRNEPTSDEDPPFTSGA